MIAAGYSLCRNCGRISDDRYYYNSGALIWVQLVRTPFGKYKVVPFDPDGKEPQVKKVRLCSRIGNEPLHTIQVQCNGNHEEEKFTHTCPFCGKSMVKGMGELPTYVIGVIGSRSVGKSSWIHATATLENIAAVNFGRKDYLLEPYQYLASNIPDRATEIGEEGKTVLLKISKSVEEQDEDGRNITTKKGVAQVLLLDMPGEIFGEGREAEFEAVAPLFEGKEGYTGVDGVIFMMDDMRDNNEEYSVEATFNRVNAEYRILSKIPVGIVLNKVDKVIGRRAGKRIAMDGMKEIEIPWLTVDTFTNQGKDRYTAAEIVPRVTLETALLSKMEPAVTTISQNNPRCAGFLIKAGRPFTEEGEAKTAFDENIRKSSINDYIINVMDPLVWMMNELDIFPLE